MHPLQIIGLEVQSGNSVCVCVAASSNSVFSEWVMSYIISQWIYDHPELALIMDMVEKWPYWYSLLADEQNSSIFPPSPSSPTTHMHGHAVCVMSKQCALTSTFLSSFT